MGTTTADQVEAAAWRSRRKAYMKARVRALERLRRRHEEEFQVLLDEEFKDLGFERTPRRAYKP